MTLFFVATTALLVGVALYLGGLIEWFVNSHHCMPILRKLIFAFLAASWLRAAFDILVRVMQ